MYAIIINGIIEISLGVMMLLFAYGVIPVNPGNQEKSEQWRKKFSKLMKVCGYVIIFLGIMQTVMKAYNLNH